MEEMNDDISAKGGFLTPTFVQESYIDCLEQ